VLGAVSGYLLSGIAWGAHELATFLLFFDAIRPEERTRVLECVADPIAHAAALSAHGVNRDHTFGRFRVVTYGETEVAILVRHTDTPVYDRYALAPGMRLAGPAIVEERESTTVLPPGVTSTVDEYANLIVEAR